MFGLSFYFIGKMDKWIFILHIYYFVKGVELGICIFVFQLLEF